MVEENKNKKLIDWKRMKVGNLSFQLITLILFAIIVGALGHWILAIIFFIFALIRLKIDTTGK